MCAYTLSLVWYTEKQTDAVEYVYIEVKTYGSIMVLFKAFFSNLFFLMKVYTLLKLSFKLPSPLPYMNEIT